MCRLEGESVHHLGWVCAPSGGVNLCTMGYGGGSLHHLRKQVCAPSGESLAPGSGLAAQAHGPVTSPAVMSPMEATRRMGQLTQQPPQTGANKGNQLISLNRYFDKDGGYVTAMRMLPDGKRTGFLWGLTNCHTQCACTAAQSKRTGFLWGLTNCHTQCAYTAAQSDAYSSQSVVRSTGPHVLGALLSGP